VLVLRTVIWGFTFVGEGSAHGSDAFSFLTFPLSLGALARRLWARGQVHERSTLLGGLGLGVVLFAGDAFPNPVRRGLEAGRHARSLADPGLRALICAARHSEEIT
jgi:hypothetical protein